MSPSSEAPPPEPSGRWQRTGYLALAASGLVLATLFGTVAQFTGGEDASADGEDNSQVENAGNNQDERTPELGNPAPGQTTEMVDGKPVPGERPQRGGDRRSTPTTTVSIGPDGTTTVVSSSQDDRTSSRGDRPQQPRPEPNPDPTDDDPAPTDDPTSSRPDPSDPPSSSEPSEPSSPPPSTSEPSDDPSSPPPSSSEPDSSQPSTSEPSSGGPSSSDGSSGSMTASN